MRKAIILQHAPSTKTQGQLANQLWNFISVYAYALETHRECINYSFFEYAHFFDMPKGGLFINTVYFLPFNFLRRFVPEKYLVPAWRKWYKLFVVAMRQIHRNALISSGTSAEKDGPYYLSPTPLNKKDLPTKENQSNLYFDGWLFRNPEGIIKYRTQIRDFFKPNKKIYEKSSSYIQSIRAQYAQVIGVHIRQGDYKTFKGGRYYIDPLRAREIMEEYLRKENLNPETTAFIIASNGDLPAEAVHGLHVYISNHNAAEDLFILSECDAILGSDSSFGNFAAYYGNIPHVVFQQENIDWEYYLGKNTYFQNKYCTLVHF